MIVIPIFFFLVHQSSTQSVLATNIPASARKVSAVFSSQDQEGEAETEPCSRSILDNTQDDNDDNDCEPRGEKEKSSVPTPPPPPSTHEEGQDLEQIQPLEVNFNPDYAGLCRESILFLYTILVLSARPSVSCNQC